MRSFMWRHSMFLDKHTVPTAECHNGVRSLDVRVKISAVYLSSIKARVS